MQMHINKIGTVQHQYDNSLQKINTFCFFKTAKMEYNYKYILTLIYRDMVLTLFAEERSCCYAVMSVYPGFPGAIMY